MGILFYLYCGDTVVDLTWLAYHLLLEEGAKI